ncbi:MAG: DUF3087 family protein [Oceanospirillaceae bacterium]|nr:DUF3087 family protein [Oceanospirillaceae bacterium]
MSFRNIDKEQYGRRLKVAFFSICLYMLTVSLATSSILIYFFGVEGENFWLNVAGIIVAASGLLLIYKRVKSHYYLQDIIYVRGIKAQLNYIYRKLNKLKVAAEKGDETAMAVLDYSYKASMYVYKLDDNTLTMEELNAAQKELQQWMEQYQVLSLTGYQQELLANY